MSEQYSIGAEWMLVNAEWQRGSLVRARTEILTNQCLSDWGKRVNENVIRNLGNPMRVFRIDNSASWEKLLFELTSYAKGNL